MAMHQYKEVRVVINSVVDPEKKPALSLYPYSLAVGMYGIINIDCCVFLQDVFVFYARHNSTKRFAQHNKTLTF